MLVTVSSEFIVGSLIFFGDEAPHEKRTLDGDTERKENDASNDEGPESP